jgi:hypothetical protein
MIVSGEGNTQIAFSRLVGMRHTDLPGPGEIYPAGLRDTRQWAFSGYRSTLLPGSQPIQMPVEFRYDVQANPGPYIAARMSSTESVTNADRIIVPGAIGSFWMNAQTLARFRSAMTIDYDQLTSVTAHSLGESGNLVLLALQTALARQTYAYDISNGLLTQIEIREQVGIATSIITVQLNGYM